jgi:hypothetical protein
MKKFKFFAVIAMLDWPWFVQAQLQPVVKTPDGKYKAENANTGIFAEVGAEKYSQFFSQAIESPGKKILVKTKKPVLKFKINFQKTVEIKKTYVVYVPTEEESGGRIFCVEETDLANEPALLMFLNATLLLLLLLHWVIKKFNQECAFWTALIGILFFVISVLMSIDMALNYDFIFSNILCFPVLVFGEFFIFSDPGDPDLYKDGKERRETREAREEEVMVKIFRPLGFIFIILYFVFLLIGK